MSKKVLITGLLGQDGSWMTEYLLKNTDCEVYGMIRRSANLSYKNIEEDNLCALLCRRTSPIIPFRRFNTVSLAYVCHMCSWHRT